MAILGQAWPTVVAINLGIDMTGGMPRKKVVEKKLAERFQKQLKRKKRIQRLGRVCRQGAHNVFAHCVLPAIEYVTQVWGTRVQRSDISNTFFLSAAAPAGKGTSRSTSLLLLDDVAWRPAVAPIVTYANILWQAITAPGIAAVNLPTLVSWYNAASRKDPLPQTLGRSTWAILCYALIFA